MRLAIAVVQGSYGGPGKQRCYLTQGRRQICKSGGAGMLLSADILPQNTMYSNIRYDEPQKLGGLQPPSPPLVYTLVTALEIVQCHSV